MNKFLQEDYYPMLTKIRKRLQQEEGFTLIELLVVVLIIGILAAVAIPTFLSQKNKANDSNAQSNLKNAQTIVESYANGNGGSYPTTAGSLTTALPGDSDANSLSSGSNAVTLVSGSSTGDTYTLEAEGTSNPTRYWYIMVNGGVTTYGFSPTASTLPTSGNTSPNGFPTVPAGD